MNYEILKAKKLFFYLSNMLPTFIAVLIVYIPTTDLTLLLWLIIITSTSVLLALSALGLGWWFMYLHMLSKSKPADTKEVRESGEVSSIVSSYILAYVASVVSVSVAGGIIGFLLLLLLVIIFGLYALGWNVMLFNPFLMLGHYRLYWVELSDGSIGYVIRRLTGGPQINLKYENLKMIRIDDYLYYAADGN